jgi:hypothetical protein
MHTDLASGHYIDITPLAGLKAKHKDAYEGAPKLFISFKEDGTPDLSNMPVSMSIAKVQKYALFATLLTDWSFTTDDGSTKLPVPHWTGESIDDLESFGEIPIDDMNEIDDLLEPYLAKVRRKPDPTRTTTASSTAT